MTIEEVEREWGPHVRPAVRTRLGQSPDADDVMNDIYLAIFLALPKFRGESSAKTFVYSIIHRRLADYWRRKLRHPEAFPLNESVMGGLDQAEALGDTGDIETIISRPGLTASEKGIFRLLGWGLSNSEIAERAHVSNDTVRSHVKRIYRKFGTSKRYKVALLANEYNRFVERRIA